MLLEMIKRDLISLLLWFRGAMYRSPDPSYITTFCGKYTTKLDFESNAATKKNVIRSQ